MKRSSRPLRLRSEAIRALTEQKLGAVVGGQQISSTGGDPRTCCWPDPPGVAQG